MATTKLTLSAERDLIARAKRAAKSRGTSLSSMFARFLASVTEEPEAPGKPGPLTRQALGLVRLPARRSDKRLLADALASKYGL